MERLYILDGHGYIFRAYYGLMTGAKGRTAVRLSTSDGFPTGALYVYASMLIRLHLDVKPERVVVVFDHPGPTFRNEIDPEYKANRSAPPEDLLPQMPEFRPLTEAFAWPVVSVPGFEADDVIASITREARERDWEVVIFSADKDLMHLVSDHVSMIDSMRQITYDRERVEKRFGVGPELVSEWLALVGDTSDNIPGVAGIGKVSAAKLLTEYGSIDGILENTHKLKGKQQKTFTDAEQLERLHRSRSLTELNTEVELPLSVDAMVRGGFEIEVLETFLKRFEFSALIERLETNPSVPPTPGDATSRVTGVNAQIAKGPQDVATFCRRAVDQGRVAIFVVDDDQRFDRSRAVGLALAIDGGDSLYIPLRHRYLGAPDGVNRDELKELEGVLSSGRVRIDAHDAKNATKLLLRDGFSVSNIGCDTLLCSYLLDASSDHSVAELAESVSILLPDREVFQGKGKKREATEAIAIETMAEYACAAAVAVHLSANSLLEELKSRDMANLWRELELPLAEVLSRVEERGILLDTAFIRELSDRVGKRIAELETEVFSLAGESFNLGSPKQLREVLFERMGLRSERMKKTKTGYSVDHEVLEAMKSEHEIVAKIIEHRELVKLKGTYLDALPPLINPATGRLHTVFRQAVAATGRLSSQEPNLQNIPIRTEIGREVRKAFVAAEDSILISADYSQIELRVMAHLSKDPVLVEAFQAGVDVHTQTAAEVFGIDRSAVDAGHRRVAKAVNYGLIYGQSEFGLARALDISRAEARSYIEIYFERFSRVREFMNECVANARRTGFATTILDRRRPIPNLRSKNYQQRTAAERVAQNTPMQGSAADIMKLAMIVVEKTLKESKASAKILLTVHDELVVEVQRQHVEQVATAVKSDMEGVYPLIVPLAVDVCFGRTWADAH